MNRRGDLAHGLATVVWAEAPAIRMAPLHLQDSYALKKVSRSWLMTSAWVVAMKGRSVPAPLDSQICFTLYATSIAITRTYKPMLDSIGITYPQYLVLTALGEEDGLTVGAIADRLALESSTVTPLVKRLEQASLVGRRRSVTLRSG